jgi:hypothetical protein
MMMSAVWKPSHGFIASVAGLAMTLFSWYAPWEWPAWPALTTLHLVFGSGFGDLSYGGRAAAMVALIAVNTGAWAGVFLVIAFIVQRLRPRRVVVSS